MIDIIGYEGLYAVTSCGRVYSYKSKKFLKPWNNGYGYLHVTLYKNGKTKKFKVHRLVAEAYIENPEGLETVDHIDGDKTHNNVQNLQWMTLEDNIRKAQNKTIYQFTLGGNLIKVWPSAAEASRETSVMQSHISLCANGKRKTAGGYIWKFDERSNENG